MSERRWDGSVCRFVFVRHGEALNAAGRCIGHTDLPLSDAGAAAVKTLATGMRAHFATEFSSNTWHVVSSDLSRARTSAAILAEQLGLASQEDSRLREMNFGAWDGLEWSEIEATDGERCRAWMERWTVAAPPQGETVCDVTGRASDWFDSATTLLPVVNTIVVVTHAGWIRAALCVLTGTPIERMFEFAADHARASIVEIRDGAAQVVLLNDSLTGVRPSAR